MKVIVKNVNEMHKIIDIDNELHVFQNIVEGYIEMPYIPLLSKMGISMIINDEGKLNGSEPNIGLVKDNKVIDLIFGNVIFVNVKNDDLTDLNENQIKFINDVLNINRSQCIIRNNTDNTTKCINIIKIE